MFNSIWVFFKPHVLKVSDEDRLKFLIIGFFMLIINFISPIGKFNIVCATPSYILYRTDDIYVIIVLQMLSNDTKYGFDMP